MMMVMGVVWGKDFPKSSPVMGTPLYKHFMSWLTRNSEDLNSIMKITNPEDDYATRLTYNEKHIPYVWLAYDKSSNSVELQNFQNQADLINSIANTLAKALGNIEFFITTQQMLEVGVSQVYALKIERTAQKIHIKYSLFKWPVIINSVDSIDKGLMIAQLNHKIHQDKINNKKQLVVENYTDSPDLSSIRISSELCKTLISALQQYKNTVNQSITLVVGQSELRTLLGSNQKDLKFEVEPES